jgi:lincosamide nucleotidyltransferase A/C/D/E
MSFENPTMSAQDVIALLKLLQQQGIEVILDGGWGVDALLGRKTRVHEDLDVAVLHKNVPQIRALLEARGFREVPRDDSWECNFVLGNDQGLLFDLHSCTFDETGKNIFGIEYPFESWSGTGVIDSYPVRCIPPEWLVKFHTGYKVDENDYHDVQLLCKHFNLELPVEYAGFAANDPQK